MEYKKTRDKSYVIKKGDQLHRGDGIGFWYAPLPSEIGRKLEDCQPANLVRYQVLPKRLCDLNACGVPLETCEKAQEIVELLKLEDHSFSYFGDPLADPPTITIFQESTGLNIEVFYYDLKDEKA